MQVREEVRWEEHTAAADHTPAVGHIPVDRNLAVEADRKHTAGIGRAGSRIQAVSVGTVACCSSFIYQYWAFI